MPEVSTKTIIIPDTKEVDSKAMKAFEEARSITISDRASYEKAGAFLIGLKALEKEINDTFDPVIKAAYEAHQASLRARDKHRAPIIEAEKIVKSKMGEFRKNEEKRLRDEENRLRELARKKEEEDRLREAERLINEGRPEEALILLGQEIETPPVILPETAPKVPGIVARSVWKFRITDPSKVPCEYHMIDEAKIGRVVRATEGKIEIPGVQTYEEKEIAVRKP